MSDIPRKCWAVFGSTGEYSDRHDWPILGFLTQEGAEQCVATLDEWARANGVGYGYEGQMPDHRKIETVRASFPVAGSHVSIDYTGVGFSITEFDLVTMDEFRAQQPANGNGSA